MCAEQLDLGLPYSDALFAAVDLSEEACEELAVSRGADRSAFRSCIAAGATSERLARDEAVFDAVNGDGVPLLFVGRTRLEGQQRTKVLEATISDALLTRP